MIDLVSTIDDRSPTDRNGQTNCRYQIGFFHKMPPFVVLFFGLSFQFADSSRPDSSLKKSLPKP